VGVAIFIPGWGSYVWRDTHLTYVIEIALTMEFTIHAGGERYWALE
jgi:hypothetical protein